MTLPLMPIGDYVVKVETWDPRTKADGTFKYIDLSSVDKDIKCIVPEMVPEVTAAEAPSRARQIVRAGDILVATVRPNLNGVAMVGEEFDGATASTGYCVLRPKPNELDSSYLFHWVKTPAFVAEMVRQATGASYPAVSDGVVKRSLIPLPSFQEQKRIAAILDKADAIRRKRQQAIQMADQFLRAVFLDMFGDPVTNPKGWGIRKFGEVGSLDRGKSKHRPRNDPALLGGAHPLIQTGDVANSSGYIREYKATYSDLGLQQSRKWPKGTLCITIAANIAKTGILTFDACFPDSVVGFTPGKNVTVEYVQQWISFLQKTLEANAPESAQKNINLAILRDLDIPVPDIEVQTRFSQMVRKVVANSERFDSFSNGQDELFSSLSQKAFAGEL